MNTSRVVALSSAVAFATQVAFALLMLHWFSPQEVGEFSVISQIGFFWMTLALAQSQLSVLANQHLSAHTAAQHAWRTSVLRGLALLPIAALAVWFSQLAMWPTLLWAMLLAVCQMGWMLAQSFTLRAGSALQQAAVRVLPPITAAAVALTAAMAGAALDWHGPSLVLSALMGYAVGALWLVPALRARASHATGTVSAVQTTTDNTIPQPSDTRNVALRMTHTFFDAFLATSIIMVWQRLYGAEETGWMSALLRVLGFVPAVVHMAWTQVALAGGMNTRQTASANLVWLGFGGFVCVVSLGLACATALHLGWLAPKWSGSLDYVLPLVAWQGCACLSAAFSHRPFQNQAAERYSIACIGLALLQVLILLAPIIFDISISTHIHFYAFSLISSLALLVLTAWMSKLS
jgi:hypothetical protein